mmetsp:Transcript_27625/g.67094  ORF Transcript_27625/g.67094 Transcript_27625/m.67094 type:complete len:241 (+) Transcript_27625:194-916(+)
MGRNAVHRAANEGDAARLRQLLTTEAGRRALNEADGRGETPLFDAVQMDRRECVQLMLEAGADPNVENSTKRTPIFYTRHRDVADMLIAAGANPDQLSSDTDTALHRAVDRCRLGVIDALVTAGATTNIVAVAGVYAGTTPREYAIARRVNAIADLIDSASQSVQAVFTGLRTARRVLLVRPSAAALVVDNIITHADARCGQQLNAGQRHTIIGIARERPMRALTRFEVLQAVRGASLPS